ncbi:Acetylcholinesterase-like [Micromonospora aurantiaca ATCC 27029]|nr:Acetylcholinesterase-like [Micromonospora aurantiaca ATCC 27029]
MALHAVSTGNLLDDREALAPEWPPNSQECQAVVALVVMPMRVVDGVAA